MWAIMVEDLEYVYEGSAMLDSFVPTAYRTEFTPWPVSERYAATRHAGTPEAQLLPGELTVHRGDGAVMSYSLNWPENFGPADKPIALRPRYKNSYPQDFVLTVQVRDAQLLFSVSSRSFWEQRDGRAVERGLIARGYLPLDAPGTPRREKVRPEEGDSSPAISSAPPLLGWDIADTYPARMALIRALCEGLCASLTAQATALAPGEARADEREDRLQAVHLNASARPDGAETGWETPAGMVRALIIEQDESAGGEARAYYANVLSPAPNEFGNIVWSTRKDAEYFPYRPVRHKPIFHAPCPRELVPSAVQALVRHLPEAPAATDHEATPRSQSLPTPGESPSADPH